MIDHERLTLTPTGTWGVGTHRAPGLVPALVKSGILRNIGSRYLLVGV